MMTPAEVKTAIAALTAELESTPAITDERREAISQDLRRYDVILRTLESQITADLIEVRAGELKMAQDALAKAQATVTN